MGTWPMASGLPRSPAAFLTSWGSVRGAFAVERRLAIRAPTQERHQRVEAWDSRPHDQSQALEAKELR